MTGKALIMKNFGDSEEWAYWIKTRNARGKKDSWCRAVAKRAARALCRKTKTIEYDETD